MRSRGEGGHEEPGGARRGQEESRGSQEEPGGARGSQEEPGGAKRSQGGPGGTRGSQGEPGSRINVGPPPNKPDIHPPTPTGGRGGAYSHPLPQGGRGEGIHMHAPMQDGGHEPWSKYAFAPVTLYMDLHLSPPICMVF